MAKTDIFSVIDIETTGGTSRSDRITEIAIINYSEGKIIDTYSTLIHPERSIPPYITRITGITNDMVRDSPKFFEVAKKIVNMTEGTIFVAHNVRFDYSFIQQEFKNLGYTFSKKKLCTLALSRKLIPGLKSYGLKNLTQHFNIELTNHHRALDDAKATTELLGILMKVKGSESTSKSFINQGIHESRLPASISLETLHALPESCGVYYLHDAEGHVIYVGKSINIQKRIMEHFSKMTRKAAKLQEMVYEITYEITGSELVALLMESTEIKRLQPVINKTQKRKTRPFNVVIKKNIDGYLALDLQHGNSKDNDSEKIKSFRSKKSAQQYIQWATREFQLCSTINNQTEVQKKCFLHTLGICKGACVGKELPTYYNERVFTFMDSRPQFEKSDFLIIEDSKSDDGKAVIVIQDGEYYGYGFLSNEDLTGHPEDYLYHISPQESNDEVHSIIYHHIRKNKVIIKPF